MRLPIVLLRAPTGARISMDRSRAPHEPPALSAERCSGPIFTMANGSRLDRHGASRIVRRLARRAGISKRVGPHTLRHAFITAALDAGVPLRDVQEAAQSRRPAHHHALRPRPCPSRPSRHLHRLHLHCRRLPLTKKCPLRARQNERRAAICVESTAPESLCAHTEIPRFCSLTLIDDPGSAGRKMGHRRPFRCQRPPLCPQIAI